MNVRELIEALDDYGDHLRYMRDDDYYEFSLGTEVVERTNGRGYWTGR